MKSRITGNGSLGRTYGNGSVKVGSKSIATVRAVATATLNGAVKLNGTTAVVQGKPLAESIRDTMVRTEVDSTNCGGKVGAFSVTLNNGSSRNNSALNSNVAIEIAIRATIDRRINAGITVTTARVNCSINRTATVAKTESVTRVGRVAGVEGGRLSNVVDLGSHGH